MIMEEAHGSSWQSLRAAASHPTAPWSRARYFLLQILQQFSKIQQVKFIPDSCQPKPNPTCADTLAHEDSWRLLSHRKVGTLPGSIKELLTVWGRKY